MEKVKEFVELVKSLRPVRVWMHFSRRRGNILAQGLSFQALFAVFAAIWVGFATGGLILRGNPGLADAFFDLIAASAPGLIQWEGSDGIIDPAQLLELQLLGITGIIAAAVLAWTALAWLTSAREAVRALFVLPPQETNFVLLKLKDAGLAIGFGVALIVSAALSVFSTEAFTTILGWVGVDPDSTLTAIVGRATGLLLMLVIDTLALIAMFRVLAGLVIPLRRLIVGALLGGIGLGVLKVLGTLLLGAASRNPLLASFAVLLGLLIWFNLVCTVILLSASWIAVGMNDAQLIADPHVAAKREQEQREERERIERIVAERLRMQRSRGNWFTRLLRRDPSRAEQ